MASLLTLVLLLAVIISQVYGGYWVCDWVKGKGWKYCSRGFCNSYGKKRDLTHQLIHPHDGPVQQDDGTYCDGNYCYLCEDLSDTTCHLTPVLKDHRQQKISHRYRRQDDCP
ncbi:unnamed protein product [Didymodactylos carnosus]|uniref:Uncharacterized protein n=1 Tax=Didymodactylos carnosus TaxID=1234261 RepID=A0A815AUY7_9BILA|nr:unnamed protein product [Didymodactylos carnosus]CAF4041464.1 unnamed protein product [Didymodactylos carnosus]